MRNLSSALALACTLGAAQAGETNRDVAVHVTRAVNGPGVTVEVTGLVASPLAIVAGVIGDVTTYPSWIPAITEAAREDDVCETRWKLPWPVGRFHERVRMERRDGADGSITFSWQQVSGALRRNEGSWTLTPRGASLTEVRYITTFQLHRYVPFFVVKSAERRAGPRLLHNLDTFARQRPPRS
jgi:hypothetical protein